MTNIREITVQWNGEDHPDLSEYESVFLVSADQPAYSLVVDYLNRLLHAGIVEDWESTAEGVYDTPESLLAHLKSKWSKELEEIEAGYEERQRPV